MANDDDRWESWVREHLKGRHLHDPPTEALRKARALGSMLKQPATSGWLVDLLFDSLAQPLPAGVRSSATAERRLLYGVRSESGVGQLDLRLRHDDDGTVELTGQLLPPLPGAALYGTPRKSLTRLTETGEFVVRGLKPAQGSLRLEIRPSSGEPISIPEITLAPPGTEDE